MPGLADVPPRPLYGVRFGSGAAEVTSTPSTRAPTACAPLPSPASTRWISALSRRHKAHERPPRAAPPRLTAMLRGRMVAVNGTSSTSLGRIAPMPPHVLLIVSVVVWHSPRQLASPSGRQCNEH